MQNYNANQLPHFTNEQTETQKVKLLNQRY